MRNFPSSADLSREQQKIYSEHLEKALLITGPPGTGKTVMAIMRGQRIIEHKDYSTSLLMYNNALKDFTKSNTKKIEVLTMDSYLKKKFNFSWKDMNDGEGNYEFPWNRIHQDIKRYLSLDELKKVFPSQVVIDEGQDFPPILWEILSLLWSKLHSKGVLFAPSVMADENQRLHIEANSNIDDIRKGLGTVPECFDAFVEEKLTRNYRNTFEIAEFAKHFYVGNQTEIPNSDQCRAGIKPTLFFHQDRNSDILIERILNFKQNNPTKTIGIIIPQKSSAYRTERLGILLKHEVTSRKLEKIKVQYRVSKPKKEFRELNDLELDFDATNTITVLTQQSSKGLEFDCVFVPYLNQVDYQDDGFDQSMTLYVIFHRARDYLFLGSNVKKSEDFKIPDILCKPLRVKDYKGDPLTIGFNNKDELRDKVVVEDGFVQDETASTPELQTISQPKKEMDSNNPINKKKLTIGEFARDLQITTKALLEHLKKAGLPHKKFDDEISFSDKEMLLQYLKNKQKIKANKLSDAAIKKEKKRKEEKKKEEKALLKEIAEFIQKNSPNVGGNRAKLNKMMKKGSLITYDEQNRIRARWEKLHKEKNKVSITKKNSEDMPSKLEFNMVSGNQAAYRKIIQIVKNQIEQNKGTKTQVVTLKRDIKKVFKLFSRFFDANIGYITMIAHSDCKIHFKAKNKQREISILNTDSQINWKEKVVLLGLEDLTDDDLNEEKMTDFLLKSSLLSKVTLNIIHPNTADETPGVKYMNEKNDDGSIQIKYEEF